MMSAWTLVWMLFSLVQTLITLATFIESEASAAICFTKDISEGITSMYSRRAPKFKGQ